MISVLRIGHRIERDKRVTTHVALVARAFGADVIYVDKRDTRLENTIKSVCERFGGDFEIYTGVDWKKTIKGWEGISVHLTMYGELLSDALNKINTRNNILIVVGSEKVPPELYELADFNVAIGNQPHSEIAALALFLDRYTKGYWERKRFNGRIEIVPTVRGKKVINHG